MTLDRSEGKQASQHYGNCKDLSLMFGREDYCEQYDLRDKIDQSSINKRCVDRVA